MKKKMKKLLTFLLAAMMMFSTLTMTAAAEEGDEYLMFLAYGGDAVADAWDMCWANEADNATGIVGTTAMAKVGDTVTIGVTLPTESVKTWYMAPVIIAEGVSALDYTINSVTVDGADITDTIDLSLGEKEFWYEATGTYTEEQAVRLKGGYNEWAEKYIPESPVGFTEIIYTITLNAITLGGSAAEGEAVLSDASYPAFIGIGGDISAENAWDAQYYGAGNAGNTEGVVAVDGEFKNGETTTLSVTFPEEVIYTWFAAPCFVVEDPATIAAESTFDVKVYLDGEEVAVDLAAGVAFWAEGTGDYATNCVRIAGGYNEWGDKYIAESPKAFKEIKFEVTPTIYVTSAVATEEVVGGEFDPEGTYHAYLGVQTPTWIFRNSFDDTTYGLESGCFDQLGLVDGEWIAQGGTFTDAEITGNGTYTVSLTGYDFTDQLATDGLFNLIFLSTDLPINDAVVISDIVLKMDGSTIAEIATPFPDPDSKTYQKALLANIWNADLEALPYYAAPTDSIEIQFTVSGFTNDLAVEAPVEETVVESTTPAETVEETVAEADSSSNTGLIVVIVLVVIAAVVAAVVVSKKKK